MAYGADVARLCREDIEAYQGLWFNIERTELRKSNRVRQAVDAAIRVRLGGGRYGEDWFIAATTDEERGRFLHTQHQVDEDRIQAQRESQPAQ